MGVASHEGGDIAELGHALDQLPERLAHGGEVVDQVGRNIAQVFAVRRLDGKPEADPRRIDGLQGLVDGRLGDLDRAGAWFRALPC